MGRAIDYNVARELLEAEFANAEQDFLTNARPNVPSLIVAATDSIFASGTQAFREALIGCAVARLAGPEIDIRLPYMNQGEDAFNGRTLDERVVNPFLQDRNIPCSKGPYLSAFRRNIRFEPETARGLRDKDAYSAFLEFVSALEAASPERTQEYLRYLLRRFVQLRNASDVPLARIQRLSLEQYGVLINNLLQIPSGGLLPVLLAVAMFQTIRQCFDLDWEINWQGINVADRASGVGGDITIRRDGSVILAVEITERPIDRSRVVSTFNTKIVPHGIEDYLFFFSAATPTDEARAVARRYFAQGHDISFLPMKDWLIHSLGTIGPGCRGMFTSTFLELLGGREVPANLKLAWNDAVRKLVA